jgi:hypothetical protein
MNIILKPVKHKGHHWLNTGVIVTNRVTTKVQTCQSCKCEKRVSFDKLTRGFIASIYFKDSKELHKCPACITYENLLF